MIKRNQLWVGLMSLCLTLGACQAMSPTGSGRMGQLSFSVAWPGQDFVVHAIPAATRELRIEITGEGLAAPLLRTLTRDTTTLQLELPAGPKSVKVEARDSESRALAVDVRAVTIIAGQSQRLEMTLQPIPGVSLSPEPSITPLIPGTTPAGTALTTVPGLLPIPNLQPVSTQPVTTAPVQPPLPTQTTPQLTVPVTPPASSTPQTTPISDSGTSSGGGSSGGGSGGGSLTAPVITSFLPTQGPVGTQVTITGTNLNPVNAVSFNGISALFTIDSSTQITATVPAGATSGSISLSTGLTTAASAPFLVQNAGIENLRIQSVFALQDDSGHPYIRLTNTGNTAVSPAGLYVFYTPQDPTRNSRLMIPAAVSPLNPGSTMTLHLNQSGVNSPFDVYFPPALGYSNILYKPETVTEVRLCTADPCTASTFLSYLPFGDVSQTFPPHHQMAVSADLWNGPVIDVSGVHSQIEPTNPYPGDAAGQGIDVIDSNNVYQTNENLMIEDGITKRRYTVQVAADSASLPTLITTAISLKTVSGATITFTNMGDGVASGIQVNSTAPFANLMYAQVRNLPYQIYGIDPSTNRLMLNQGLTRDVAVNNTGSGVSPVPQTNMLQLDPTLPAFGLQADDKVKLNSTLSNTLAGGQLRRVTAVQGDALSLDSGFATLNIDTANTGAGISSVTVSDLLSGVDIGQFWQFREKAFDLNAIFAPAQITFSNNFIQCDVTTVAIGQLPNEYMITTSACAGGSATLISGDKLAFMDAQNDTFLEFGSVSEIVSGSSTTGYSLRISSIQPLNTNVTLPAYLKLIPKSGSLNLIPQSPDSLSIIPTSGTIKPIPVGGFVARKKAIDLTTCNETPSAACYTLVDPLP